MVFHPVKKSSIWLSRLFGLEHRFSSHSHTSAPFLSWSSFSRALTMHKVSPSSELPDPKVPGYPRPNWAEKDLPLYHCTHTVCDTHTHAHSLWHTYTHTHSVTYVHTTFTQSVTYTHSHTHTVCGTYTCHTHSLHHNTYHTYSLSHTHTHTHIHMSTHTGYDPTSKVVLKRLGKQVTPIANRSELNGEYWEGVQNS